MTDLRSLVARMADELDHGRQCLMDDRRLTHPLADEARALLAQPEPQPPAAGEVAELPPRPSATQPPAHHALTRYGVTWDGSPDKPLLTPMADGYWTPWHVAAELLKPPAADEVAELVAWLRDHELDELSNYDWEALRTRAAELLERLASPACLVLKPSPELIEAFQEGLKEPGVVVPMQPGEILAASRWQPIDTAPRDGTEILASDLDCIDIVSWWTSAKPAASGWINREGEDRFPCDWQPLPDHPEVEP